MDFAKKILSKYGWKDGEGLGKNKHGIAKPLKATLKFDKAGFGADQAVADFNNHWWERVFNEAAINVEIKHDDGQTKINLKDDKDRVEISTKGYSMKKLKRAKQSRKVEKDYDNFLQAATLTNQGDEIENPNKIDTDDIEITKVKVLTDEELFKACGGRTAHKGARHGLKLSGKLSRIEQQDEELLAEMMEKRKNYLENDIRLKKTQKKIVKHKEKDHIEMVYKKEKSSEEIEPKICNNLQTECIKSSKEKKKRRHSKEETAGKLPNELEIQVVKCKKKKIHDNKNISLNPSESSAIDMENETELPKPKKKSKKR